MRSCPTCGEPNANNATYCFQCKSLFPIKYEIESTEDIISIGNWILTLIILGIPIIGFIALVILAFSSPYKSKQNFARAILILMLIAFVLALFLYLLGIIY